MDTNNTALINEFNTLGLNYRDTTLNEDEMFDMYEKAIMSLYNKRYESFKKQHGKLPPDKYREKAIEFNTKFGEEMEPEFMSMEPVQVRREQETEQALGLRGEYKEMAPGVPATGAEAVLGTQEPSQIFQPTDQRPPVDQTTISPQPDLMGKMGA